MAETAKKKPANAAGQMASLKAKAKADFDVKAAKLHVEHIKAESKRQQEHDANQAAFHKEHMK